MSPLDSIRKITIPLSEKDRTKGHLIFPTAKSLNTHRNLRRTDLEGSTVPNAMNMKMFSSLIAFTISLAVAMPMSAADQAVKQALTKTELAAVSKFRKEMGALKTWLTKLRDDSHGNEGLAHQIPVRLAAKLAVVRTEGLPKDLGVAFQKLNTNLRKHAELLKDMPKDDGGAMIWMTDKLGEEKFNSATSALQEEQWVAEEELATCAEKYGAEKEAAIFDDKRE